MWSGPRNISTALMRAWENRPDTVVYDEPFYAHYLAETGIDHPGREEIIAADETDWRRVVERVAYESLPPGKTVHFQKQMTHHMLEQIDLAWLGAVTNCFLLRTPAEVINSYIKVRPDVTLFDIGFAQQQRLFRLVREQTGQLPPVIDSRDVLENPRRTLMLLCDALGVPFDERMLAWPTGPRPSDGVWAKYWYSAVQASTGFEPYRPRNEPVPDHLLGVLAEAEEIYHELYRYRLG
ncbi:MAG: HAD family hydrolase [Chloroflexi bacterium]|nr:HAD family hydrolase [Chloroflexota bacterium]